MCRSIAFAFVVLAAFSASCSSQTPDAVSSDTPSSVASALESLTPAQRAGQRIIYSYPGLTPPQALFDRIRAGEAAGVHFNASNVASTSQIRDVIAGLAQAQKDSPVRGPLLFLTDQEGGPSRALPGEPALSEKQIGQSPDGIVLAARAGEDAGENLHGVGINVNLAPVLDVFRQPGNFIDQAGRSYSNDPHVVRRLGSAFVAAQQDVGVASTGKHFPGLGSAAVNQNTDEAPVTLTVSRDELRRVDEAPYAAAISAGLKVIMVSWATYPSLDPNRPAGLSQVILQEELREHLGFQGVTVSDTLIAGAVVPFGTVGQRAVLAVQAGMDLLLCSFGDVGQGDEARDALATALQNGQLDKSDFNAGLRRIRALRNGLR